MVPLKLPNSSVGYHGLGCRVLGSTFQYSMFANHPSGFLGPGAYFLMQCKSALITSWGVFLIQWPPLRVPEQLLPCHNTLYHTSTYRPAEANIVWFWIYYSKFYVRGTICSKPSPYDYGLVSTTAGQQTSAFRNLHNEEAFCRLAPGRHS